MFGLAVLPLSLKVVRGLEWAASSAEKASASSGYTFKIAEHFSELQHY